MWTVYIRDQTALSVRSDLDLHYPQKLLMSSSVREELKDFIEKKKTKVFFHTSMNIFDSKTDTMNDRLTKWNRHETDNSSPIDSMESALMFVFCEWTNNPTKQPVEQPTNQPTSEWMI